MLSSVTGCFTFGHGSSLLASFRWSSGWKTRVVLRGHGVPQAGEGRPPGGGKICLPGDGARVAARCRTGAKGRTGCLEPPHRQDEDLVPLTAGACSPRRMSSRRIPRQTSCQRRIPALMTAEAQRRGDTACDLRTRRHRDRKAEGRQGSSHSQRSVVQRWLGAAGPNMRGLVRARRMSRVPWNFGDGPMLIRRRHPPWSV
jgi:hypothetical protein